jgi:hypothetical protein
LCSNAITILADRDVSKIVASGWLTLGAWLQPDPTFAPLTKQQNAEGVELQREIHVVRHRQRPTSKCHLPTQDIPDGATSPVLKAGCASG